MPKADNKSNLKVKPGTKKDSDTREKAKGLLRNHPEILYNARSLFHNENGKTVVEDRVPRGDESQDSVIMPRNQYDLHEEDLQAITKQAKKLVNSVTKEYDERVAMEDALTMAIGTLDEGKYAGKVNASTYNLILDNLVKSK